MKLTVRGENLLERIALALGIPPVTLVDTHMSFLRARAIMTGVKLGVFDALADGPLDAAAVAAKCATSPFATAKLLSALTGSGYVAFSDTRFSLTSTARKWLLKTSPTSLREKVLFEFVEWDLVARVDQFVRTGVPLDIHTGGNDDWGQYQRAMRALSGLAAPEIVQRTPMPAGATAMLDIGGSHGFISVAMCRRYPALRAVVFDLPQAIEHAAPILARENLGDRVTHRAGNALTDDLGEQAWDFIYVSQLVHHFDEPQNETLMRRIARALKPNGIVCILDMIRPTTPDEAGQVGALLDLYFALTSQSGTWSVDDIARWQRTAGLTTRAPIRLRTVPGAAEVIATNSNRG